MAGDSQVGSQLEPPSLLPGFGPRADALGAVGGKQTRLFPVLTPTSSTRYYQKTDHILFQHIDHKPKKQNLSPVSYKKTDAMAIWREPSYLLV